MSAIAGLREAVIHEARERENRAAVAFKVEAAYVKLTDATAERHDARARAAAGESVKLSSIENALRAANDEVALLGEALEIADKHLEAASAKVATVLNHELLRRFETAQASYNDAMLKLTSAAQARSEADVALQSARSALNHPRATLLRTFAVEISRVS